MMGNIVLPSRSIQFISLTSEDGSRYCIYGIRIAAMSIGRLVSLLNARSVELYVPQTTDSRPITKTLAVTKIFYFFVSWWLDFIPDRNGSWSTSKPGTHTRHECQYIVMLVG